MKSRSYQELYDYLFGNLADIAQSSAKTPDEYKVKKQEIKIEKIRTFFLEKAPPHFASKQFCSILRELKLEKLENILYDPKSYTLPEVKESFFQDISTIDKRFKEINLEYHFFSDESYQQLRAQFQAFYYICRLVREIIEREIAQEDENNIQELDFERAYKMLVLFGGNQTLELESKSQMQPRNYFKNFDTFIAAHGLFDKKRPLHDVFMWLLPKNDAKKIHLNAWRKIIYTSGRRTIRLFSKAPEIENMLSGNPPKNYQEAFEICKNIVYAKASEDFELANLCMHYDVNEEIFNRCLDLKRRMKDFDLLPDVIINGSDKEINHPGYYLVKLPVKDPRAFILGHITDCCQSIGGHSENCVIDGVTLQHNGFYVLLKEKKQPTKKSSLEAHEHKIESKKILSNGSIDYSQFEIVGQGYAWLSNEDNLTFDSWENLRESDDTIIFNMLTQFAKQVCEAKDSSIFRVTIGTGGKTPNVFKQNIEAHIRESIYEGMQYGDSLKQRIIYCNSNTKQKLHADYNQIFQRIFAASNPITLNHMVSYSQLNRIKALRENAQLISFFQPLAISENCREIQKKYSDFYFYLLEILSHLNKSNLCTPEVIHLTINSLKEAINRNRYGSSNDILEDELSTWINCIKTLEKANLLTDENYKIVALHPMVTRRLTETLIELQSFIYRTPNMYEYVYDTAVDGNNLKFIAKLIKSKAISARSSYKKFNPLTIAIKANNLDVVKLLIAKGADLQQKDSLGNTPLHIAITFDNNDKRSSNNIAMLQLLIEHKANIHEKNAVGDTPLHCLFSAERDKDYASTCEKIKLLIAARSDINTVNLANETPLVSAIKYLRYRYDSCPMSILLQQENIIIEQKQLSDPKTFAIITPVAKKINVYSVYKVDLKDARKSQDECIGFARTLLILTEAKYINSNNINNVFKDATSKPQETHKALQILVLANLLTTENLDILFSSNDHTLKLSIIANLIVSLHENTEVPDLSYSDILFEFISNGFNSDILISKMFESKKVDINAIRGGDYSLFAEAMRTDNKSILKHLLEEKANPNGQDLFGNPTLLLAFQKGTQAVDLVKKIIEAKADVNAKGLFRTDYLKDKDEFTALFTAVTMGNRDLITLLLNAKADPNIRVKQSSLFLTPLYYAIHVYQESDKEPENRAKAASTMKDLLEAKANVHIELRDGLTTLDLVNNSKIKNDIIKILTEAKADFTPPQAEKPLSLQMAGKSTLFTSKPLVLGVETSNPTPVEDSRDWSP